MEKFKNSLTMGLNRLAAPDFYQRKTLRDLAFGVLEKLVDIKGEPNIEVIP